MTERCEGALPPIRRSIEVAAGIEDAFRLWSDQIGQWWPLGAHSVGRADTTGCFVEGRLGGRVYETTLTGQEHLWGTVTAWAPPHRIAHSWHPGRTPADHTTLEVRFC
jgi:uncharacterized protein YndB with AHSA1/START domain